MPHGDFDSRTVSRILTEIPDYRDCPLDLGSAHRVLYTMYKECQVRRVARLTPRAITQLRRRLGMSVAEFANLFQVSRIAAYKWESGERRPDGAQLLALKGAIARVKKMDEEKAAAAGRTLVKMVAGAGVLAAFLYLLGADDGKKR